MRTFNVEAGLPTLDEARRLVIDEIRRAKREGARALKVIHGYGSSGKGGALCVGLRKSASMMSVVWPAMAIAMAMLLAVVDLPSPWPGDVSSMRLACPSGTPK